MIPSRSCMQKTEGANLRQSYQWKPCVRSGQRDEAASARSRPSRKKKNTGQLYCICRHTHHIKPDTAQEHGGGKKKSCMSVTTT